MSAILHSALSSITNISPGYLHVTSTAKVSAIDWPTCSQYKLSPMCHPSWTSNLVLANVCCSEFCPFDQSLIYLQVLPVSPVLSRPPRSSFWKSLEAFCFLFHVVFHQSFRHCCLLLACISLFLLHGRCDAWQRREQSCFLPGRRLPYFFLNEVVVR